MRGLLAIVLVVAGCGAATTSPGDAPEDRVEYPPDIVIAGDRPIELTPYTFCWKSGCIDGMPPAPPPDLGAPAHLTVEFPVEGWDFTATFQAAGDPCARTQTVELDRLSPTTFRLDPAGLAGTYDVDLFGRRSGAGDVIARFRWTTPVDGPLATPEAWLAVLADHDGVVDSYGVELTIDNLATTPTHSTAAITVTASNGQSLTFEADLADAAGEDCGAEEGSLFWDGPDDKGLEAAQLGPPPFTYTVDLVLDGVDYRGTAVWPDDETPDSTPSVPLEFGPPLPALGRSG